MCSVIRHFMDNLTNRNQMTHFLTTSFLFISSHQTTHLLSQNFRDNTTDQASMASSSAKAPPLLGERMPFDLRRETTESRG